MPAVLSTQDFEAAAQRLGCSLAAIRAVCEVEAPRGGFNPDGSPVTLFEGHHFHRLTGGRFDASHPTLSFPRWTREHYGRDWRAEQDRLRTAQALDWQAASMSASWGRFQIMGFNHGAVGFIDVRAFVNAMSASERQQLDAFCAFIESRGLADELQRQDWAGFARAYNGPAYAVNKYDVKMAAAFYKWSTAAP